MTSTTMVDLDQLDLLRRHRTGALTLLTGDVRVTNDTDQESELRTRQERGHYRSAPLALIAAEA